VAERPAQEEKSSLAPFLLHMLTGRSFSGAPTGPFQR